MLKTAKKCRKTANFGFEEPKSDWRPLNCAGMNFPGFGKKERGFSKGWKIPFQSLEKSTQWLEIWAAFIPKSGSFLCGFSSRWKP